MDPGEAPNIHSVILARRSDPQTVKHLLPHATLQPRKFRQNRISVITFNIDRRLCISTLLQMYNFCNYTLCEPKGSLLRPDLPYHLIATTPDRIEPARSRPSTSRLERSRVNGSPYYCSRGTPFARTFLKYAQFRTRKRTVGGERDYNPIHPGKMVVREAAGHCRSDRRPEKRGWRGAARPGKAGCQPPSSVLGAFARVRCSLCKPFRPLSSRSLV